MNRYELPENLCEEEHRRYLQALQIVGPAGKSGTLGPDRQTIISWTWDQDAVRHALGLADDLAWFLRVLDLQRQGLAGLCVYAAPTWLDAQGYEQGHTQWQDEALEEWGTIVITSAGVVTVPPRARGRWQFHAPRVGG